MVFILEIRAIAILQGYASRKCGSEGELGLDRPTEQYFNWLAIFMATSRVTI